MSEIRKNSMSGKEKFFYVLMIIPFYIMAATYLLAMFEFFNDYLKLDPDLIFIASIIYMIINAINDPLLALWSDSIDPKKWGSRRLIFIRWGGVVWALAFAFTWIPWGTSQTAIFLQYTFFLCMLDNGLSLVVMCIMALLPEMEDNTDKRVKMGWFTGIAVLFASIGGSVFNGFKGEGGADGWTNFRNMCFILAAIVIVMAFFTTANLKERQEYQMDKPAPFWKGVGATFKSKSFMNYVFYNLFANVIPMGFGFSFFYLFQLIIPVEMITYFLLTSLGSFISPLIAMQFKKKWGMKKTVLIIGSVAVIGYIVFFILAMVLGIWQLTLVGVILMGIIAGIPRAYTSTLAAISMDQHELKYGDRKETTFLGVNALITKPGDSVGTILLAYLLPFVNYVEEGAADVQPDETFIAIKAILLLVPSLFVIIGLVIFKFYPVYGDKLKQLYVDLEELHAEKKQRLAEMQN